MPMSAEDRAAVDEMVRTNEVTRTARKAVVLDVIELGVRVARAERAVFGLKVLVGALVVFHLLTWWLA